MESWRIIREGEDEATQRIATGGVGALLEGHRQAARAHAGCVLDGHSRRGVTPVRPPMGQRIAVTAHPNTREDRPNHEKYFAARTHIYTHTGTRGAQPHPEGSPSLR